ncbi:rhodanese-like domain-containing protein [Lagierella sp.]|uniref:rhodanese-like domain-containing protein n=1 Tax=Lagierella sp. TaxID=2849657 RepID=UPI00262FD24E|nr:rhodanese-like domain-containing protein [Lagierella sp.]
MKKKILSIILVLSMILVLVVGCKAKDENSSVDIESKPQETIETDTTENTEETKGEEISKSYGNDAKMSDFEMAKIEDVHRAMENPEGDILLVDSRPQESYSGWALEGAKNGGHLKNAVLFSSRWLDCEYSAKAPREAYLERAMADQGITKEKNIIVYDYSGNHAAHVAKYFKDLGISNVTVFSAKELIDAGKELESYKNHDRFLPTEIVKNISDIKTGKTTDMTPETKAVIGDNMDNVVLIDVGWGNAGGSTYYSVGHVPGAVHINTDSYERPRVYVPEKRSDYAKEWRLIPLEEFRDTLCPQYGITKDSIVILTGTGTSPQGRLGFMLRSLGVKVYAMSGALTAWKYNGYELDTAPDTLVVPTAVENFGDDTISNPDEILWMDTIKSILAGTTPGQVADNRGKDEWDGQYSGYDYHDLAGRIEGSIWCPQGDEKEGQYFDNVDNTPRTKKELIGHMEKYGLDTTNTVAFFCGDSWGAAHISYFCQANDIETIKQWGEGWIPWSNLGNEFIDHNGVKVHYDKYKDTLLDANDKDVRDDINILGDKSNEE